MRLTLALSLALALGTTSVSAQSSATLIDRMRQADTNGDGIVTRAELITSRAANFKRFDRNGDGALADNDIPWLMRGSSIAAQFATMKAQFDTNRDGRVSRDEFVNGPTPLFDAADTNRDNRLTRAEIDAARATATARR